LAASVPNKKTWFYVGWVSNSPARLTGRATFSRSPPVTNPHHRLYARTPTQGWLRSGRWVRGLGRGCSDSRRVGRASSGRRSCERLGSAHHESHALTERLICAPSNSAVRPIGNRSDTPPSAPAPPPPPRTAAHAVHLRFHLRRLRWVTGEQAGVAKRREQAARSRLPPR
jgi:hypothetical protein